MTVLYASNNTIHLGGNIAKDSITSRFDNSKYDYGFRVNDYDVAGQSFPHDEPVGDTVYYQWQMYSTSLGSTGEDGNFMNIKSLDGTSLFTIDLLNNEMRVQVFGDTTVTVGTGVSFSAVVIQDFKVRMTVNATEVTAELFHQGSSIGTATAANTGGKTIGRFLNFQLVDATTASYLIFSGIVISDTDLHNFGFTKLKAASAGTDTDFAGNAADVADDNDTTGIIGSAVNEKSSFNMEAYSNGSVIHAYMGTAVLSAGTGAPGNYRLYLLIGGVRYYGPTEAIAAETTILAKYEWPLDPSDNSAWTQTKVNAAQLGVEIL